MFRYRFGAIIAPCFLFFASPSIAAERPLSYSGDGPCVPRVVRASTHYPRAAQSSMSDRVVRLRVMADKHGVTDVHLERSSGNRLLDRAALDSARTEWVFDVSHCAAEALRTSTTLDVRFKRVPTQFSGIPNRSGLARAKRAANDPSCSVTPSGRAENLISCW